MKYLFRLQLVFTILVSVTLRAQFQNANWYFGDGAGVSFNGITPTNLIGGQTSGEYIASASISDEQGNLLFYTDGKSVYDKNHNIMQNGNNSLLCSQGQQSVVIVPIPNSNMYYIFTENVNVNNLSTMYYFSIVNMDLNSGVGIVETLNQPLFGVPHHDPNTGEDYICAYYHNMTVTIAADGESYWLIIKPYHKFYAFNITENIFNPYPTFVESTFGDFNYECNESGCSTVGNEGLKASPDGSKLALVNNVYGCMGGAYVRMFDFDGLTGVVSNDQISAYLDGSDEIYLYDSLDFSPQGNYIYLVSHSSTESNEDNILGLYRYDISNLSLYPVILQEVLNTNCNKYSIQRAIDGKLYIGGEGQSALSVINNPDEDSDIVFELNAIDLIGNNSGNYLPQLAPYHEQPCPYNIFIYNTITDGDVVTVEAANNVYATNTIKTGATVTYNGGNSVVLGEYFEVENNAYLEIRTTGCNLPPPRPKGTMLRSSTGTVDYKSENEVIQLYPNPSFGKLNYKLLINGSVSFTIIDSKTGVIVEKFDRLNCEGTLNLTNLKKGIYFLKIISKEITFSKTIVIE